MEKGVNSSQFLHEVQKCPLLSGIWSQDKHNLLVIMIPRQKQYLSWRSETQIKRELAASEIPASQEWLTGQSAKTLPIQDLENFEAQSELKLRTEVAELSVLKCPLEGV